MDVTLTLYQCEMQSAEHPERYKTKYGYNYYGYSIVYYSQRNELINRSIDIVLSSTSKKYGRSHIKTYFENLPSSENYIGAYIIGDVVCYLSYLKKSAEFHAFQCDFELHGVIYQIYVGYYNNDYPDGMSNKEFLSFLAPVLKNRYKGNTA